MYKLLKLTRSRVLGSVGVRPCGTPREQNTAVIYGDKQPVTISEDELSEK